MEKKHNYKFSDETIYSLNSSFKQLLKQQNTFAQDVLFEDSRYKSNVIKISS